ncbi:MAG: DUF1800 domain-containing protein, partial [Chloroflexota bacterium]
MEQRSGASVNSAAVGRRAFSRAGLLSAGLAGLGAAVASAARSRSGVRAPLASERDKVAHLLRRAGFGSSPEELEFFTGMGVAGAVDYLLNYEQAPDDVEERLRRYALNLDKSADMQRWWLLRMIYTKRPLLEKMTLFWHGLLVSAVGKVGLPQPKPGNPNPPNLMLNQNRFFREHALDDFGSIMKGISRDPAMVVYLDSNANRKGKPNENYARELLELFTLGVHGPNGRPNYTEQDVREVARAFTGWGLNKQRAFAYAAGRHDNGRKTIVGRTGNFDGNDVIDLILAHPSCAWHVSTRLFEFFAYDQPEPATLAPVVDVFRATKGSIKAVVQAILTSPALYSARAYRAKVKAPIELIAGMARALGLETDAQDLPPSARRMGQTLFNPPNVAGWPGGEQWLNTTTWLERVNLANRVLTGRRAGQSQRIGLLSLIRRGGAAAPEQVVDSLLDVLVDGQVGPEQRQTLM